MPTLTDPAALTLAKHFAAMGGWLTIGDLDIRNETPAFKALLTAGHVELADRDRIYRLTDAGYAWLAAQGS